IMEDSKLPRRLLLGRLARGETLGTAVDGGNPDPLADTGGGSGPGCQRGERHHPEEHELLAAEKSEPPGVPSGFNDSPLLYRRRALPSQMTRSDHDSRPADLRGGVRKLERKSRRHRSVRPMQPDRTWLPAHSVLGWQPECLGHSPIRTTAARTGRSTHSPRE